MAAGCPGSPATAVPPSGGGVCGFTRNCSETEACVLNVSEVSQRRSRRQRPLKKGYTDPTTAALDPAIELKREGRASLVRRDGMHSNELAQNSPDIVFVVRYLRICKGPGYNGGRTRASRGSDKTRGGCEPVK